MKTTFPIITSEIQSAFEKAMQSEIDRTPDICGFFGRACRQLGKAEGANRANCMTCPLAVFSAKLQEDETAWVCTDPDCSQYSKQINDYSWSYIEIREIDDQWVVCHSIIDLRDYSFDELWDICSGYYQSYEDMVEIYGFREALHVMAECIFEQLGFIDMEFNASYPNNQEADSFVQSWIKNN